MDKVKSTEFQKELILEFKNKFKVLENFKIEEDNKKLVIIISAWERDSNCFTEKILCNSLRNLLTQLENFSYDIFLIANNGGGRTNEIGNIFCKNITNFIKKNLPDINFIYTENIEPTGNYNKTTPWKIKLKKKQLLKNRNNFVLIKQKHKIIKDKFSNEIIMPNAGKIRALRDITELLIDLYKEGYQPNTIYQMDIETILEYEDKKYSQFSPFKKLFQEFKKKNLIAIGTKDKFTIFNPKTGLPTTCPEPSIQLGFEMCNKKFISLSGGSMLIKSQYYIAGINTICKMLPCVITEDYVLTLLLMQLGLREKIESCSFIRHLNRCPKSEIILNTKLPESHIQIKRWLEQSRSIEKIFSKNSRNTYMLKIWEYSLIVIKQRIINTFKYKDLTHLKELVIDTLNLPDTIRMFSNLEDADLIGGKAHW